MGLLPDLATRPHDPAGAAAWGIAAELRGGARRTKVIPRLTTERAAMKLVFAVLIRCSERWSRVSITDIEGHQLKLMRAELGNRSTADFRREGGTLEEKEDRVMTQVAPFTGDSGLDLRRPPLWETWVAARAKSGYSHRPPGVSQDQ
jgi:hypothetical protein